MILGNGRIGQREVDIMIQVKKSADRGRTRLPGIDTVCTFPGSGAGDAAPSGFRKLRALNEERLESGKGHPLHPHRDLEILTCVLEGALANTDSFGIGSIIHPDEWQRISAGCGITHQEQNASEAEPVHYLQIWIEPNTFHGRPSYQQLPIPPEQGSGRLRCLASGVARPGRVSLQQDAEVWGARLAAGESVRHALRPGRHAWVQIVRGAVTLNGRPLEAGDGAGLSDEHEAGIAASGPAEILLIDLP